MFKRIKQRWQNWLDGTTVPVYAQKTDEDPLAVSVAGRPNPYRELAPLNGATIVRVPGELPTAPPVTREYEADMPEWALELLNEMDSVVGVVVTEEVTEVRTPQYVRRHRRGLMETIGDTPRLRDDGDVPVFVERMLERARRASDTEITGMIPVIDDGAQEEAYI
jgi:hypothetical protein